MAFQVLINRCVTCPNRIWSCDVLDDQFLGWSCVIFPGSRAVKSCDMLGTGRSCDESRDGSCDRFPWSHVLEITWLELGLGVVMKRLVIVEWVLGSFGNAFLVGASFARNISISFSQIFPFPPIFSLHISTHYTPSLHLHSLCAPLAISPFIPPWLPLPLLPSPYHHCCCCRHWHQNTTQHPTWPVGPQQHAAEGFRGMGMCHNAMHLVSNPIFLKASQSASLLPGKL